MKHLLSFLLIVVLLAGSLTPCIAQDPEPLTQPPDGIPAAAWSRPIGQPVRDPSRVKVNYPTTDDGPVQGAPLGGIGAGTFSRTYAGNFARWHFNAGYHIYQTLPAFMFSIHTEQNGQIVNQALWTGKPENTLGAWQWEYPVGAGTYYALYPRSWFVYDWDALPIDLSVEQLSPIIPGDYQTSSYPVALFNWTATNPTDQPVTVGIMFTGQNLQNPGLGQMNFALEEETEQGRIMGIQMNNMTAFQPREGFGQNAIAVLETPGVTASYYNQFNVIGDGADIWEDFSDDGALSNIYDTIPGGPDKLLGGGLAITFELDPGETITAPFVMSWDFPVMSFGQGQDWFRRYTAFFGRDGDNAWDIAKEGLAQIDNWRSAIEAWQEPILADDTRPLWYKTALFNELYFVADGGTAWEHGRVDEPEPPADYIGHFAYMECFDYPFYNTFDVDFYASFALMELWPEIELGIMRDFAATVPMEDNDIIIIGASQQQAVRKIAGAVPHDLGRPDEAPWVKPNGYSYQDVNGWKDLNAKYILRLYRDAVLLDRPELVSELWSSAVIAAAYLAGMDSDGDGIPENDGIPDQTYDGWIATGVSAYSGGLWLAALAAMSDMATMVGEDEAAATYAAQLELARATYQEKLWNGEYFDYDETSDTVMADQLAGEWYARITGIPTLPDDQVDSALNAIYIYNVMGFNDGQMGAVNGMQTNGRPALNEQGEEVWAGTTYMLAAHMLYRGLDEQGWATAYGVYKHVYETGGLWFRTPEAWNRFGDFRASMYMRPLAIWAMETALERR